MEKKIRFFHSNWDLVIKRLLSLEKKLLKSEHFKDMYYKEINDYIKKMISKETTERGNIHKANVTKTNTENKINIRFGKTLGSTLHIV